jgi:hypothetical protein
MRAVSLPASTDGYCLSPFRQEGAMRQTIIVAAITAVVTAIVSVWGTTAIIASSQSKAAVVASGSVEVMRMMREAKALPEERFDAN